MSVQVLPYAVGYGTQTKTDDQGQYSVCGPPGSKVGLEVFGSGYATAFKFDLTPQDHIVSFALRRSLSTPYGGGTVRTTIRGDEFAAGDDYFGGRCEHTACKVVGFDPIGCPCPNRGAEITLRWSDPASQLALYFPNAGVYWPPPSPVPAATRYGGPSPVVTTYVFNSDFDVFAVGFEQANGRPAGAADQQSFELTVRPTP